MLPPNLKIKRHSLTNAFLVMLITILHGLPAYADDQTVTVISASEIIQNIAGQLPSLMRLITSIAFVMGMYFVFYGLLKLKQFGEARTQMSSEHHLRGPLIFLVVGALLLYLPSSVQVGLSTFWSSPSPYGYLQETDQWSEFFANCFLIIQIFGTMAFIRGLIILSHLGGHGGQPGTLGKGVTHIIGGLFCINIYQFIQLVMITLGISYT